MPSKTIYFRPIETHFVEVQHSAEGAAYNITALVAFFSDEAMGNKLYEKEFIFERVPFKTEWMGLMGEIYTLINQAI